VRVFAFLSLCVLLALQPACVSKETRIRRAFNGFSGRYVVFVSKKNFSIEVFNRRLEPVAGYRIALGANRDRKAKLYEGDNRTPEGLYRVNEILSMDADKKSPSYKTLRKMNRKFFRARDGHCKFGMPGVDLGDNAYGPRFFGLDYPNGDDRKRYRRALRSGDIPRMRDGKAAGIGWGIGIHGNNDENSVGNLSSNGCLRMYNRDVVEFEQYIQMGTPVILSPE
jgi:murein L,D-transpeptidase YafK